MIDAADNDTPVPADVPISDVADIARALADALRASHPRDHIAVVQRQIDVAECDVQRLVWMVARDYLCAEPAGDHTDRQ